uniref:Pentatricopeptide repeat-containing protein n=1 Tax=Quercus lobata TaxID=97700 RepID=A0A7N2N7I3_QUELO
MLEMNVNFSGAEKASLENVIRLLCRDGKIEEGRNLVKRAVVSSLEPSSLVINEIARGYCKKKDFEDLLSFFAEMKCAPTVIVAIQAQKGRQFDEVKMIVCKMASHGFLQLSSLEDPLSKAFMVLRFNPSAVRLKRDNDAGFSKTEFLCNLGNGLYLDTDLDEYGKTVTRVLEDSMLPDFSSLVMQKCDHGNFRAALELLGQETLNLLVQAYSKKGLTNGGRLILDRIHQRHLIVKNEAYTALIMSLWLEDCKALVGCLCQREMLVEALQLLELHWLSMMISNEIRPSNQSLRAVISSLCNVSDIGKALQLSQEMESRGWVHNSSIQNTIVGGLLSHRKLQEAEDLLDRMSINTSGMLIHAFCQNGRTAEAEDFLISMLQVGESPTREMYSTVINRYRLEDNLKKASEFIQVMQ